MKNGKRTIRWLRTVSAPIGDPRRAIRALVNYIRFTHDLRRYKRMAGAETVRLWDLCPALHDRTGTSEFDPHYFHVNAWAIRQIRMHNPSNHVDIASQLSFASMLSGFLPVTYFDFRPLKVQLKGLSSCAGSLLDLPFADHSISSLSCLHVVEHVGLGRYGDPLDPNGTRRACNELARVLAPGGVLLLAMPVGKGRVCFNAHRILAPTTVVDLCPGLSLQSFSGVDDAGIFHPEIQPDEFTDQDYACGMYTLIRRKT
jgi:hypothetical protein